jgi:hypothetical protein
MITGACAVIVYAFAIYRAAAWKKMILFACRAIAGVGPSVFRWSRTAPEYDAVRAVILIVNGTISTLLRP